MAYMNWLVFGIGAIGTYVGGCLELRRGRERLVTFIDRPEVVAHFGSHSLLLDLQEHRCSNPGAEILRYAGFSGWAGGTG